MLSASVKSIFSCIISFRYSGSVSTLPGFFNANKQKRSIFLIKQKKENEINDVNFTTIFFVALNLVQR